MATPPLNAIRTTWAEKSPYLQEWFSDLACELKIMQDSLKETPKKELTTSYQCRSNSEEN